MSESQPNQNDQDEAALDAVIAADFQKVKAGEPLTPTKVEMPAGETGETGSTGEAALAAPTGETGPTGEQNGNSQAPDNATGATGGDDDFRTPNKGKFESDDAYDKRIELFDLVKKKNAATNPEAKSKLLEQIKVVKGELKTLGGSERIIPKGDNSGPSGATGPAEDPAIVADRARLKALGGVTKEEIEEINRENNLKQEIQSDLKKFVEEAPELKDPDIREAFFDFVDSNYNWEGKTGKALRSVLGMAYESMFRPKESVQDRVLKGAKVQEKVNAMQFPGGTGNEVAIPADKKASIDEMMATGMSREKAMELLSD